ncbi:hypothetical protein F4801DRAFT_581795 [Xylaria longipes]|nr:hypothetical protein F4801DRAFT_581795 [Xylaria longipes]
MSDNKKPSNPPKKDPPKKEDDKKQGESKGGSLDWLHEAANYEPPKQPPKSTGDWMKDDGNINKKKSKRGSH